MTTPADNTGDQIGDVHLLGRMVLNSPNGSQWEISVSDSGELSVTQLI